MIVAAAAVFDWLTGVATPTAVRRLAVSGFDEAAPLLMARARGRRCARATKPTGFLELLSRGRRTAPAGVIRARFVGGGRWRGRGTLRDTTIDADQALRLIEEMLH